MKRLLTVSVLALFVLSLFAGCVAAMAEQGKAFKFAYICKQLNDEWFSAEDEGMKNAAAELGVEYVGYDVNNDNERCMLTVESVIAEGFDGVMMCIPDVGISTAVAKRFEENNIPLLAIDDYIEDEDGNQLVPYLGVPTYTIGYSTGLALAQAALDRGFFDEGNVVKVMALTMASTPTVNDTVLGHIAAIREIAGDKMTDDMVITVDCKDGSFDQSIIGATATFNANPDVTHWIIPTGDDYIAFAAVKMLIENQFDFKNAAVCGNGAYTPSKEVFEMGGDIANSYMSAKFFPWEEGDAAIRILYDYCANGTPIPWDTRVGEGYVSIDNWTDWSF